MHGHAVEGAKTLDQVKLIGLGPCRPSALWRFLGLFVVNAMREGQDLFGPFAKREEANDIFSRVVVFYTPPT